MIVLKINYDFYYCNHCEKAYSFDTSKPYSKICPECNNELEFSSNADGYTELAEKVKNTPPYDPTKDPNSPLYIPIVECPYCHSTDTKKISAVSKGVSVGLFGIFGAGKIVKQWHCNKCGSDF